MFGIQRILITAMIALWLPLCCCQMMAFANAATGVETSSCCQTDEQTTENTSDKNTRSCCGDEQDPADRDAPKSCLHCATKGPPPTAPSLDSFFILSEIPFALVLPPLLIEPVTLHATEIAGCWDVPPPTKPPRMAMSANDRRATFSIWII
ncbi:MAG: hypothetical protein O2875_02770 [Planctomycetota bacterium]|nr:hypothetical protein [Planctomycetota bacterium]